MAANFGRFETVVVQCRYTSHVLLLSTSHRSTNTHSSSLHRNAGSHFCIMVANCNYPPTGELEPDGRFAFVCTACGHVRKWNVNDVAVLPVRNCGDKRPVANYPKPPFLIRLVNYVTTQTHHFMAGRPKCTPEQIEARLAICRACPLLQNNVCSKCGCNCTSDASSWFNKLVMADQSCPLEEPLWERVDGH